MITNMLQSEFFFVYLSGQIWTNTKRCIISLYKFDNFLTAKSKYQFHIKIYISINQCFKSISRRYSILNIKNKVFFLKYLLIYLILPIESDDSKFGFDHFFEKCWLALTCLHFSILNGPALKFS